MLSGPAEGRKTIRHDGQEYGMWYSFQQWKTPQNDGLRCYIGIVIVLVGAWNEHYMYT